MTGPRRTISIKDRSRSPNSIFSEGNCTRLRTTRVREFAPLSDSGNFPTCCLGVWQPDYNTQGQLGRPLGQPEGPSARAASVAAECADCIVVRFELQRVLELLPIGRLRREMRNRELGHTNSTILAHRLAMMRICSLTGRHSYRITTRP